MRALAAALACLGLVGCGESTVDANFTGLEIQASYPRDLGLERMLATGRPNDEDAVLFEGAFSPLRREGGATLVEPLLFILDPGLANRLVEVDLEGIAGDTVRARGQVQVRLRLGEVRTTTVAMTPVGS